MNTRLCQYCQNVVKTAETIFYLSKTISQLPLNDISKKVFKLIKSISELLSWMSDLGLEPTGKKEEGTSKTDLEKELTRWTKQHKYELGRSQDICKGQKKWKSPEEVK